MSDKSPPGADRPDIRDNFTGYAQIALPILRVTALLGLVSDAGELQCAKPR
jgi:hypothetical protein